MGRLIASAEYGTNGGTALTRFATVPVSSNVILVSQQVYDNAGRLLDSINPAGEI